MACVIVISKLIGLSDILMRSLLPKSITIPMGSVVSEQIGGIPSVTIISIVVTGITGAVAAPAICRICRIKHKVAQGIAIGTASHALGTTKAMEMGEIQGAMSSLSIGVASSTKSQNQALGRHEPFRQEFRQRYFRFREYRIVF